MNLLYIYNAFIIRFYTNRFISWLIDMQQPSLFDASLCTTHTVSGNNVAAIFHEKEDWAYEVVLSVSSHKFLLHIKPWYNDLEEFEIQAMRWYIDYNVSLMHTLKKIMKHICYWK